MTRTDALKCMLELAQKGEWHFNLSAQVFPPESAYGRCTFMDADEAFGGSLDSAKALHEAVLPGWWVQHIGKNLKGWGVRLETNDGEFTDNVLLPRYECPARAWLIAILKALISIEESKE